MNRRSESTAGLVNRYIGSAFDKVKVVADNIEGVVQAADNISSIEEIMPYTASIESLASNLEELLAVNENTDLAVDAAASAITSANAAGLSADTALAAQGESEVARDASQVAQGLSEDAESGSEAAKLASIEAKDLSETAQAASEVARDESVIAKNLSEAAQSASEVAQSASESAQLASETARDGSVNALDATEIARDEAVTAQGLSEAARDNSIIAKDLSVDAQLLSETARDESVTAKGLSETAQTASEFAQSASETARDESVVAKDSSLSAQTASEAARDASVVAKDSAQGQAASASSSALAAKQYRDEASEIAGLDDVTGSVGLLHSNIAFEATFNDSNAIQRGYGTHDVIDVSAAQDGSIEVELPTKSIDFSCVSERAVINKSGVLESVGIDKPAIGADGEWLHGAYTNDLLWSEDFTNSSWDKQAGRLSITSSAETFVDGVTAAQDITANTDSGFMTVRSFDSTAQSGTRWVYSVFAKAGTIETFDIAALTSVSTMKSKFNLSTGVATATSSVAAEMLPLGDGWYQCISIVDYTSDGTIVQIIDLNTTSVEIGDYLTALGAFASQSGSILPYVKTESTAVSVAKTIASIPAMNNLPAAGESFAIEVDCTFPLVGEALFRHAFMQEGGNSQSGVKITLYRTYNDYILFTVVNKHGLATSASIALPSTTTDLVKYVCRYVNNSLSIFQDGVLSASASTDGISYSLSDRIALGANGLETRQLNAQLKNFRIHHGNISDGTIKSWGGAK